MGFSKAQTEAIQHTTGPCLVLAGPGSGKTLTIVNRIKSLIENQKVRPEEILVITFTKYAATEMKERFIKLMGGKPSAVTFGTFHGIYYGILKWAYRFGPENILSEEEKLQILEHLVRQEEMEIFDPEEFMQDLVNEIGVVKNHRCSIDTYESKKCPPETFRTIYRAYEKERKQLRKIDFDDMLVLCYELFQSRPDVLKLWQDKFRYILVDEFQDINQVQYDVIRMLAAPQNNLFVVGDDDQAIYGFRGADSKLMFAFQKDFPDAKQMLLDINFRSTENIVKNALKVIANNEVRYAKKIRAKKPVGQSLHVQEVIDSNEEGQYIIEDMKRRIQAGVAPEEIAILYRVHTDARAVVEHLLKSKMDFQMKERLPNLYQHFIAKDVCAYFRLAMGKGTRQDLLGVMNRPKRYLSRDALSSKEVNFEAMRTFYVDKDWMMDRVDQLEWDLKMLAKMAPYAALQYLKKRVGYEEFLREYAKERKVPIADLQEIYAQLEESARPHTTMEAWFSHMQEYQDALREKERSRGQKNEGIRLMTMHAAKGLEFDTVYIIEANEGQIPYKKALKEHGLEEERRLFYVGMTRAKEVLRIVYVKTKNGKDVTPSRFVEELLAAKN